MMAAGIRVIFIFESLTTRAFAGFSAGAEDAVWAQGRVSEVGYPASCTFAVCAADTPEVSGYEGQISQYFTGWKSVVGSSRLLLSYGSKQANDASAQGGAEGPWGVGTWNYGEGRGSYQLPDDPLGAWLLQSGNTPGPLPDTDYNRIYVPIDQLRAWGGPQTPQKQSNLGDLLAIISRRNKMYIGVNKTEGWFVVEDGRISSHFGGTPQPPFGVPTDLNDTWKIVPSKQVSDADVAKMKARG